MSFVPTPDNRILQEVYRDDPWKLLVGCILLNLTSRAQVDRVREELFERWPSSINMEQAGPELEELIRPLGLWQRRANTLRRFSSDWTTWEVVFYDATDPERLRPTVTQVEAMYGIGKYALDSYRIFVMDERLHPEDVEDRVLRRYLQLRQEVER